MLWLVVRVRRGAILMLDAGVAWGIYSLRGKDTDDPIRVTAGDFLRVVPIASADRAQAQP